jgi:rhamnogalacturonan endolyase
MEHVMRDFMIAIICILIILISIIIHHRRSIESFEKKTMTMTSRELYEAAARNLRSQPYPPPYAEINKSMVFFDRIKAQTQSSSRTAVANPSKVSKSKGDGKVNLIYNNKDDSVEMNNGIIRCVFSKKSFRITSMHYRDLQLSRSPGWNQWNFAEFPTVFKSVFNVTIDPKTNDGRRAEIAFVVTFTPHKVSMPKFDMEVRYAMERGLSGVYTSMIMTKERHWQKGSIGEARYLMNLNPDVFDYFTLHSERRQFMPKVDDITKMDLKYMNMFEAMMIQSGPFNGKIEDKYDYSEFMSKLPAYGWSSTSHGVGVWFINPTQEYITGGPTKVELTGHRALGIKYDIKQDAPNKRQSFQLNVTNQDNVLLNMWCGTHYGGPALKLNGSFTKVIGPFLIYVNSDKPTHDALFQDALKEADKQRKLWPYEFFKHPAFYPKETRGAVSGTLKTDVPTTNAWVGLVNPSVSNWELEAINYQFWAKVNVATGTFLIENVPQGTYTLFVIAEGCWGDFSKKNIIVQAGRINSVGEVRWKESLLGKTVLWQIGTPTRNSTKFRNGNLPMQWGLFYLHNKQFPKGCKFIIGSSQERHDWNYCQSGRVDDKGYVSDSTWHIEFNSPRRVTRGTAYLRLAFCGWNQGLVLKVALNNKPLENLSFKDDNNMLFFNGTSGRWTEKSVIFDATAIKEGTNDISLTLTGFVSNVAWWGAVHYDSIKLEIDDTQPFKARST